MPYQTESPKRKDFMGGLGLFSKVLIFIIVIIIATILLFGLDMGNLPQLIFNLILVAIGGVFIFLIIRGALSLLAPKPFSPEGAFRTKIVNQALKLKPSTVNNLYIRGEGIRSRAMIGKIIGLAWIPYRVSRELKDEKGNIIYMKDSEGTILKDRKEKPIPQREILSSKDGDILFVVKSGMFGQPDLIRCHPKYASKLVGDVYIEDVGFTPYGEYFYPAKQWQESIQHIMLQSELETITMTHANNLDFFSDTTRMSIGMDANYMKLLQLRDERLMATPLPQSPQGQR